MAGVNPFDNITISGMRDRKPLPDKILAMDINVRVCFMSSGEINREALRIIYLTRQEGCFIRKPVTTDYLLKRIRSELD